MTKKEKPKKNNDTEAKFVPENTRVNVGGDIIESVVVVGDNNVVNYYSRISNNVEKHEPDYWNLKHPYPMPPNFTGRVAERAMLTQWLNDDSENHLFILRALGGFGKSALTWHWLTHDVDIKEWPKVVFWSFYEGDASFEHFIEETLKYLELEVPQGQRPQVEELIKAMQSQKILLIMDGFERALRAYGNMNAAYQGDEESKLQDNQLDCVNINAEIFLKSVCSLPNMKGKVLMTTRLTPRTVKPRGEFLLGCCEKELTSMKPTDAVEFFHKQKIKGTHAEIEAACAPYGYHPLSLRLLAGRVLKDFENPGDIVIARKLKTDGNTIQQKHHVLEVSYNSLPAHEQNLLSTIACFRSPVEHKTLEAIAENKNSLDDDLHDLIERGLLHFDDKNKKFDLHPIVRRYAYERLTAPDRTATHTRLRDYFAATEEPEKVEKLEELAPVIELYYHLIRLEQFDDAIYLFESRLGNRIFNQFNAYQLAIDALQEIFPDGENNPPRLKEEDWQAWTLNFLANIYGLSGLPNRSVPLFERYIAISDQRKDIKSVVIGLENIADDLLKIGKLADAEYSLRRALELAEGWSLSDDRTVVTTELGHIHIYTGNWTLAQEEIFSAKEIFAYGGFEQSLAPMQTVSFGYLTLISLTMGRAISRPKKNRDEYVKSALAYAQHALEWAEKLAKRLSGFHFDSARDFIRAHWLLGASLRFDRKFDLAETHLSEALTRDRAINIVDMEADILLDLARLRYDQKKTEEAKSLAEEALSIAERCGYVLQGADVNLFLAQYALEQEKDKVKAKEYAESALKLAYCDGPPYYYKVAYEEAERMLEKLK